MKTKYILIERKGFHPTAVEPKTLALMKEHGKAVLSERPITQKEMKTERIHVYSHAAYMAHWAAEEFYNKFNGKVFKAQVISFDRSRGIALLDGLDTAGVLHLYACNIPGKKTWFPETACVYHDKGEVIEVELIFADAFSTPILVSHTPGIVDEVKWNEIKEKPSLSVAMMKEKP